MNAIRWWCSWLLILSIPAIMLTRNLLGTRLTLDDFDNYGVASVNVEGDLWVAIVRFITFIAVALAGVISADAILRGARIGKISLKHPLTGSWNFQVMRVFIGLITTSALVPGHFYGPLLATGAWCASRTIGTHIMIRYATWVFVIICAGSLVSLIIDPQWARGGEGMSTLMGDPRLFGLAEHPSVLFPCALGLIILVSSCSLPSYLTLLGWISGLGCILLANNVTAWISLLSLVSLGIWYRYRVNRLRFRPAYATLGVSVITVILAWTLFSPGNEGVIDISSERVANISGRAEIWPIALHAIYDSPVWGHGLDAFRTPEFRAQYGMSNAGYAHAHNQYLDVAVQGGFILLFFFLRMLYLFYRAIADCKDCEARRVSSALLLLLLIRGLSECPFEMDTINGNMILILIFICMVALLPKEEAVLNASNKNYHNSLNRRIPRDQPPRRPVDVKSFVFVRATVQMASPQLSTLKNDEK